MNEQPGLFNVRMSNDLKAEIKQAAKANNRSMNAEIIHRLEQSLGGRDAIAAAQQTPPWPVLPEREFYLLVQRVRTLQREYFRTRDRVTLEASKTLEKELDEILQRYFDNQTDLFVNQNQNLTDNTL